jgi:phospholipid/cholesterol/gamma-HCH transport system substrate-binding protein
MKKSSVEMAVGLFVIIGIICVSYLTIHLGDFELFSDEYYSLYARFQSVSGLKKGAMVELAGVEIGDVDAIELDPVRQVAIVKLKISNDITLTEDVIASIKTSGLIGDKFIELSPGGADKILKHNDMITETESPIDIEALISKYVFGGIE